MRGMVAKVSGFPGFMSTLPKCTCPQRWSRGFTRSLCPMETPPAANPLSLAADKQGCQFHDSMWTGGVQAVHSIATLPAGQISPRLSTAFHLRHLEACPCRRGGSINGLRQEELCGL